MTKTVLSLNIKDVPLLKKGKVREVYDLGGELLFVATDRISAFDVVMPSGIPDKGKVLNKLSEFWFHFLSDTVDNHLITADIDEITRRNPVLKPYLEELAERSMLVKKTEPILIECVVRGYITGSGWKDYKSTGEICGVKLPGDLKESDRLERPIFSPAIKADTGHDENVTQERTREIIGDKVFDFLKEKSMAIYERARGYAEKKGIIIADTKFEFGKLGDKIILIDEVLTPDSSRFWPKDDYKLGRSQKSFDKQFVRDYLEGLDWDKTPPGPALPADIVERTREKYLEAYKILTGKAL